MALNAFCRALGTVFGGLRDALVEVMRDGDMREHQETDMERIVRESDEFVFRDSPAGDGIYNTDSNGLRDPSH